MTLKTMEAKVVIIGGGVSGLTLATFLQQSGIRCIVLERRDRAYIEKTRQRAGAVEARAVQMFERWGLADKLLGGTVSVTIDYRLNGSSRVFELVDDQGSPGRFCTQQMLVNNLFKQLIDVGGGDVRFSVSGIKIKNVDNQRPKITFTEGGDTYEIICDYLVGCDGDQGISRKSIPEGVLTKYGHEFGYAWLAALVEAPLMGHPIMGVSDHGFVAQLPRGPQRSRYYIQCTLTDTLEDWSDERFWDEVRLRTGDSTLPPSVIHDKVFVPLRSVVYAPMRYLNLFLAGDAAHLVPPTGAKGMNLALHDVDVLAQALQKAILKGDESGLKSYSDTCLASNWKYQEFSHWMTETMHDAGDPKTHGRFRQMIARARLDSLFSSTTAGRLHSEYLRGMI